MKTRYDVVCWMNVNGRKEMVYKKKGLTFLRVLLYLARNIGNYPMMWVENSMGR